MLILTYVEKGATNNLLSSFFQVCILEHNDEVLSPELQEHWFKVKRCTLRNQSPDRCGSSKIAFLDSFVRYHGLKTFGSVFRAILDVVEYSGREAGLSEEVRDQVVRPWTHL